MHSVIELFDAVKTAQGAQSDYRLSKLLGVTTAAIGAVRKRGGSVSDETAIKIAELSGLPADYCVACAHAARSSDSVRPIWERIAKKAAGAAALVLLGCALPQHDAGAVGERAADHFRSLYIM